MVIYDVPVRNAVSLAICDGLLANGLLVGLDVELDEEAQVAREQKAAEDSSALRSSAATEGGEVREVVRSIVRVRCETRSERGSISHRQNDALAKYTTKRSMTNCTIWKVVRYFFHYVWSVST